MEQYNSTWGSFYMKCNAENIEDAINEFTYSYKSSHDLGLIKCGVPYDSDGNFSVTVTNITNNTQTNHNLNKSLLNL